MRNRTTHHHWLRAGRHGRGQLTLTLVLASLAVALLLCGCGSSSGGGGAATASSLSSPSVAPQQALPESTASSAPATPNLASKRATWDFKRGDGYTCSVTFTVWAPPPANVSSAFGHPAAASDAVDPTADWDPKTDLVIPFQVKVENTTSGFELSDARTMVVLFGLHLGSSKLEISADHPKLMVSMFFFSDGPSTTNWQVYTDDEGFGPGVKVMGANTNDDSTIITWSTLSPQASSTVNAFIILHDYYSPASPAGAKALLSHLAAVPSLTMDDWTDVGKGGQKCLTLSGKVVSLL